jgi:1-acyl-sn-glycerol-3-phosphate acyltransferase
MSDRLADLWYQFSARCTFAGLTLAFRFRAEGREHVPRSGPVLVVANHQSFLDPVAVGSALLPRSVAFLARKGLFTNRLFGGLIRSYRAVPINQDGVGTEGIRAILEQLRAGRAVLVFPEGERTGDGRMHELKPGVALLLRRVQAPVLPVGIAGAYELWPRTRPVPSLAPLCFPTRAGVAVSIGRPLNPEGLAGRPRGQVLEELFKALQGAVARAERLRERSRWRPPP